jgi:ribosome biogenesis protein Nip4
MTKDDSLFLSVTNINEEKVIFWDNSEEKIIGVGNIRSKSSPSIEKVFLVNNL